MSDRNTKARASEMLAALRGDRFLLYPEQELIGLGVPWKDRQETQAVAQAERAKRPYNPNHMPSMTSSAAEYLGVVELAQSISKYSNNWLRDHRSELYDLTRLWNFHVEQINNSTKSCLRSWDALTEEEKLWFDHKPHESRWAFDFPLEAPAPYRFYPLEETPERTRQIKLLEQLIQTCGDE